MARERINQAPEPGEQPKKRGLKRFILPAVLGVGAMVNGGKEDSAMPEKLFHFDIGPLAARFIQREEIPGKYTILQVGQLHGDGLAIDKAAKVYEYTVRSQKDIEAFILYAREKYSIDTVFDEGMDAGDQGLSVLYDRLNEWDAGALLARKRGDQSEVERLFRELRKTYNENAAKMPDDHRTLGIFQYFIRERMKEYMPVVSEDARHWMRALVEQTEKEEIIARDNAYVTIGAAWILWVKGRIRLAAGDDHEARLAGLDEIKRAPGKDASPDAKEEYRRKIAAFQKIREDRFVKEIAAWMKETGKVSAILNIGDSHVISGNIARFNLKQPENEKVGVTRFASQVVKDLYDSGNPYMEELDINEPGEQN